MARRHYTITQHGRDDGYCRLLGHLWQTLDLPDGTRQWEYLRCHETGIQELDRAEPRRDEHPEPLRRLLRSAEKVRHPTKADVGLS